ncbi:MAG: hypothetical protein EXR70_23790 [Deltaproteobacteria bacterium]|nr:hypothetical protein [Deltaproteobacteria bacterium]
MHKPDAVPEIQCPCGHKFKPFRRFVIPADIEALAKALELPAEAVTQMLSRGETPQRRAVDKNGRRYGPVLVFLDDALRALREVHSDAQKAPKRRTVVVPKVQHER